MDNWDYIEISRDDSRSWDAYAISITDEYLHISEQEDFNVLFDDVKGFASVHDIEDIRLLLGDD